MKHRMNYQTNTLNVQTGEKQRAVVSAFQMNRVAQIDMCPKEELNDRDLNISDLRQNTRIIR